MVTQTPPGRRIADDATLTRRAFAAYFRAGGNDQPAWTSGVRRLHGHVYVSLHNVNGLLAVYRVRNDGYLKAMRRWPHELDI